MGLAKAGVSHCWIIFWCQSDNRRNESDEPEEPRSMLGASPWYNVGKFSLLDLDRWIWQNPCINPNNQQFQHCWVSHHSHDKSSYKAHSDPQSIWRQSGCNPHWQPYVRHGDNLLSLQMWPQLHSNFSVSKTTGRTKVKGEQPHRLPWRSWMPFESGRVRNQKLFWP